ncbi:DUF4428 domain-containing protein [Anaerotignum sp.]|uniref:DUF4428 domain-containing protein n=1 Tax=Anaerotignum sp. TaxID=2039241 RepID=UPI0028A9ECDD|nr:DUF4428 domain-containing protein [Anaerotignum sp.]
MGLFSKKEPCPICGGKIDIFFPRKIEGQLVCDNCYDKLDVQEEILNSFTMADFREYLSYYEQNQQLREGFNTSYALDFSVIGNDMVFDFDNKLFCVDDKLNKLIFAGKDVVSIVIKEDSTPLFECNHREIKSYQSSVKERALQMAPQLAQMVSNQRLMRNMERITREEDKAPRYIPIVDLPEPFKAFHIHIKFEHPYWNNMDFRVSGPTFSNEYPDVNEYIKEYTEQITNLEAFINAFRRITFSDVKAQPADNNPASQSSHSGSSSDSDPVAEIKKYKELMEGGIITEEEFSEKKRQLLRI